LPVWTPLPVNSHTRDMGTPISFRLFHHWLATGKTGVAIQLAMIGKLRFYSQTRLNSQAARDQMKGNSGVFNRHPLFYCHKSAYMIAR